MKTVISNSHWVIRHPPANYVSEDLRHFEADFRVKINELNVNVFKPAVVLQSVLFHKLLIAHDYCYTRPPGILRSIKSYLKLLSYKSKSIHTGIWVLDQWSSGYFHWLTEALPRIIVAKKIFPNVPVLLPEYFKKSEFIVSSIEKIRSEVIYYGVREKIYVKFLVAPSHMMPAQYNKNQIAELRKSFLFFSKPKIEKKRIYISRRKAQRRRILNEADLVRLLQKYHFEEVLMEEFNFQKQIDLMAQCHFLISNHGAGLTNMLFMPNDSCIIELKADADDINNCFFNLADAIGHRYYYTLNKGSNLSIQKADIFVDLDKLEILLKNLS